MKIIFDNIIFSLQRAGGISIVWKELISRIVSSDLLCSFIEYSDCENNIFRKKINIPHKNIITKSTFLFLFKRYLNPNIKEKSPFIFHSSYYRYSKNKNAINFTTVHDFTYEYFLKGIKKWIHCHQKHNAIRHSDYIICISETTKRDLLKFLPDTPENKISVVYNGVSDEYFPIENATSKYGKYAVFVGQRSGYKNFETAVKVLKNTDLNLVIVGVDLKEDETKMLDSELGKSRYFYLGKILNAELNEVYNSAFCLLYPSLYEGFGIPVLEAQKAGCPVVNFDVPAICEIVGDRTLTAATGDEKDLLNKINLLNSSEIREKTIRLGLENAKRFSWQTMCAQIVDLYRIAMNNHNL
ncbi:MAG: glycosyltransferase family 4 protein [Paludibacter sp.]|jgi:mannosyltransferase|nr:glycosyltransferase family 4 protein [Paludibacter sp.]